MVLVGFLAIGCRSVGRGSISQSELVALEKRGDDAAARQDVATAASLLAPEYTVTHTNGTVQNREEILASIEAGRFKDWVFEIDLDLR